MGRTARRAAAGGVWLLGAGPVWAAAPGGETAGVGLWTVLFLAFGALIVAFQAGPAAVLLGSLLRSLFGRSALRAPASGQGRKSA
ncbi:MAG: hypothetical protein ACNA8S_14125 [Deferrisomatales bacterium]